MPLGLCLHANMCGRERFGVRSENSGCVKSCNSNGRTRSKWTTAGTWYVMGKTAIFQGLPYLWAKLSEIL